jgi:hypothetical protein
MTEEKRKPFFQTLPGILTGTAAILTAVTGLLAALGVFSHSPSPPPEPNGVVVEEDIQDQVRSAAVDWIVAWMGGDVVTLERMVTIPYYSQGVGIIPSLDDYSAYLSRMDFEEVRQPGVHYRVEDIAIYRAPERPAVTGRQASYVASEIGSAVASLGLGEEDYYVRLAYWDIDWQETFDVHLLFKVEGNQPKLAGLFAPE